MNRTVSILLCIVAISILLTTSCNNDDSSWFNTFNTDDELSFNVDLASKGYYFESNEEAIKHFENKYSHTKKERDLVDLVICLNESEAHNDMLTKYFPLIIETIRKNNRRVLGLNPEVTKSIIIKYAFSIYCESKQEAKIILLESANSPEEQQEIYSQFFDMIDVWTADDYSFAYKLYTELYNKFQYFDKKEMNYEQTISKMIVLAQIIRFMGELGYDEQVAQYNQEINEYSEMLKTWDKDYFIEKPDLLAERGYYFENIDSAINYFCKGYAETEDERKLVDLCICLSYAKGRCTEKEYYYRLLLGLLDKQEHIIGLSKNDLDTILSDYVVSFNEYKDFVVSFKKYGALSHSKAKFLTWIISERIVFGKESNIDKLNFLYDQGQYYLKSRQSRNEDKTLKIRLENSLETLKYVIDTIKNGCEYPEFIDITYGGARPRLYVVK